MPGDKKTLALVARLTDVLNRQQLDEIEVERTRGEFDSLRVRIKRTKQPAPERKPKAPTETSSRLRNSLLAPTVGDSETDDFAAGTVRSEMVGTAYLKASPDAPKPFVRIGQAVEEGDPILIIEAMKTMNQILSPHSGIVVKVLVDDGEPVQFGTALMVIH
ncbi:MAG: acetyl-CoA carboxylase biotin carboxyl carrier protein subunit [Rhodobacteraceae bacterium]|nr:acetyl-CoA carboxylase biotin carboxyl carrier protein subunit [Paracoccaceae bacterium]